MQSQHSCSGRLYRKWLVLCPGTKCRRETWIDWAESFHKTQKDLNHLHVMAVWELVWSELEAFWGTLAQKLPVSGLTLALCNSLPCVLSQQNGKRPQVPQPWDICLSRPASSRKGRRKRSGERKACIFDDWGFQTLKRCWVSSAYGEILMTKVSPQQRHCWVADHHHHHNSDESNKSNIQRMGARLSVSLIVAVFTKVWSSPGIPAPSIFTLDEFGKLVGRDTKIHNHSELPLSFCPESLKAPTIPEGIHMPCLASEQWEVRMASPLMRMNCH